ncbi:MAG: serine protease [Planctomycetota bacterium]
MDLAPLFFRLCAESSDGATTYLGTAFPVAPGGGLLTCRHVVKSLPRDSILAVHDYRGVRLAQVSAEPVYPSDPLVDLAFLPDTLSSTKPEFFPILVPSDLKVGEDVYSFGFFALGGGDSEIEHGFFAGKIVSFFGHQNVVGRTSMLLPYAVLEGMSGSPVLTYHNGPKLVGLAIGNRASRILAHEVSSFEDDQERFTETIHRVVEFGVALHAAAIIGFLSEAGVPCVVSSKRVQVPGL